MVTPGQTLTLTIEKPAAGGRMIARAGGQVVLVAGAIPGERVVARIERSARGVAFAETISIENASPDRIEVRDDPRCGGCLYAHIAYARQLDIKAAVIADAFARIARTLLPGPVRVAPSGVDGYRMRARLHVRGRRAGFFLEGTHVVCDARRTRLLLPATCEALDRLVAALSRSAPAAFEIEVSENAEATERVVHLEAGTPFDTTNARRLVDGALLTGLTAAGGGPPTVVAGDPRVSDTLRAADPPIRLRRHVLAFFQGNRYLLQDLVARVLSDVRPGSSVLDLYAGVGLFSTPAAARGARVTAVEGDHVAAEDLAANARDLGVSVAHQSVEAFVGQTPPSPDTLVVDPPRTGMSRAALDGAMRLRPARVVYVSCDVATLARDCRRWLDAGYAIRRVAAFDMFPRTPHVETVVTLEQGG
jgi:23S rRNA (uracil1939-C5)-methyltransferase